MDNLLNVNQVAFILKVHPLTVRRYIKEGRLKAIKAGGNIRIKESSLADFNKEFSSDTKKANTPKNSLNPSKTFTLDDPLFRLKGRGASLVLTS